jgi:hypothetical protein
MITARDLAVVVAQAAKLWRRAEEEESGEHAANTIMIRFNEDGSYSFGLSNTARPLAHVRDDGGEVPS